MATRLLTIVTLLTATTASAQLAPTTVAPSFTHMYEVNKEWAHMHPGLPGGDRTAHFSNEAERIATHLRLVRTHLLRHTPEGLSAAQMHHRTSLLERLGEYANDRTFPQNHVLHYRNPIFIDPHGTACAVGWLMIESGHRDLAEGIDAAMEAGYLAEIVADERFQRPVTQWASDHGFTADELAWIQPAYPPNIPTAPLGGGTNGTVTVTLPLNNGHLLVAGSFTEAGTTSAVNVAVWDGTTYHAMGAGVNGEIECAVEYNGSIYVGGSWLNGPHDLARWNGSTWTYENALSGKWSAVHALHVHDGVLHAAGEMAGFAGIDHFVTRLEGDEWNWLGQFNNTVHALASHNGELVAGGELSEVMNTMDPSVAHVAAFRNGTWTQLGDGLNAAVRTFLNKDGQLYAGGDRYVNGGYTFGMARIGNGDTWELLLEDQSVWSVDQEHAWISSLADAGNIVAFGGHFIVDMFMLYGFNVGGLLLTDNTVFPAVVLYDDVNSLAVHGGRVVYAGAFNTSSAGDLHHIATFDIVMSVNDMDARAALHAWPNPATEQISLQLETAGVQSVHAMDATGRMVELPFHRQHDRVDVRVDGLAPGAYTVQVRTTGSRHAARFVKQ